MKKTLRKGKRLQYLKRKRFKQNCLEALLAFNEPNYYGRIQELREQIQDIDTCIHKLDDALSNADEFRMTYEF